MENQNQQNETISESEKNNINTKNDLNQKDKKETTKKKKGISFRSKIIIFETIVLILLIVAAVFYYKTMQQKISESENYIKTNELVQKEIKNCTAVVTQEQVSVREYEFCKEFLKKFKR